MDQATLQILPLREVASQLPADCWIVAQLNDTERFDAELALRFQGDLNLRELDLDEPLKRGGELRTLMSRRRVRNAHADSNILIDHARIVVRSAHGSCHHGVA